MRVYRDPDADLTLLQDRQIAPVQVDLACGFAIAVHTQQRGHVPQAIREVGAGEVVKGITMFLGKGSHVRHSLYPEVPLDVL